MNIITAQDFSKYLQETEHIAKIHAADSYANEVYDDFFGPVRDEGDSLPFKRIESLFHFRPCEVTVWTGFSGHGKSLLLGQVMNALMIRKHRKICIASMEMLPKTTLKRMMRQFSEASIPAKDEFSAYFEAIAKYCWIYDHQGVANPKELMAAIRYCASDLGIKHFVIDSLLKCGFNEDDFNGQKDFVGHLCSIARDTGIHIHLVCHARKAENEDKIPGKHDVRGSASLTDQVDNVICVWRNKNEKRNQGEDAMILIQKQRNGEWEGKDVLTFNAAGQCFTSCGMNHGSF